MDQLYVDCEISDEFCSEEKSLPWLPRDTRE